MEELRDLFQPIIDFVLGNIGIVIFGLFLLSGLIGRGGDKNKEQQQPARPQQQRTSAGQQQDNRPLAERLAEYMGVEIPEEQQPRRESAPPQYASEGRRSTSQRNVQANYPELFGGTSLFDRSAEDDEGTKWGFDETEWGSTFVKNDDQWGNTFPDRKSSEPRIEMPN